MSKNTEGFLVVTVIVIVISVFVSWMYLSFTNDFRDYKDFGVLNGARVVVANFSDSNYSLNYNARYEQVERIFTDRVCNGEDRDELRAELLANPPFSGDLTVGEMGATAGWEDRATSVGIYQSWGTVRHVYVNPGDPVELYHLC